jgi:hypothetical protein
MTAAELVQILEDRGLNPKATGPDRWQSLCPAHEDRVPSLSIGTGHNAELLLKCHAGCGFQSILAALNVRLRTAATHTVAISRSLVPRSYVEVARARKARLDMKHGRR